MNNIKLIDVTLRDGGYKTDFHFSPECLDYVLHQLDQSGIDYIEIGYRNGSFKKMSGMGEAGRCTRSYLELCRKKIKLAKLTVMLHPHNINPPDLAEMAECGVDALRICLPLQNLPAGFHIIQLASQYNFEIFVNLTRISFYSKEKILSWIKELEQRGINKIYLADSNGSLNPQDIENIFSYLSKHSFAQLGFHAHDNLFLAQANALAALKQGVHFLDSTLGGVGKGAGNLRTEGIVSYLYSINHQQYNLCKLLDAAQYIQKNLLKNFYNISERDIILGIFNLSQDDAAALGDFSNTRDYLLRAKQYAQAALLSGTS